MLYLHKAAAYLYTEPPAPLCNYFRRKQNNTVAGHTGTQSLRSVYYASPGNLFARPQAQQIKIDLKWKPPPLPTTPHGTPELS